MSASADSLARLRSLSLELARRGLSEPLYGEYLRLCSEHGSAGDRALWDALDLIEAQEDRA